MRGCFICPIHDRTIKNKSDFELGYSLVASAMKSGIVKDLFFIFSSNEQMSKFLQESKNRYDVIVNGIVCPLDLSNCKNPVSIKKFYGIKALSNEFDYIATIDCEVKFYGNISAGDLLDEIWKKETYLASNISKLGGRDVKKCIEALKLDSNELLKKETCNYQYSWWFNEIPVYECSTSYEFFEWIEKNGYKDTIFNNWECFDYLVYVIWLILNKNKHLIKYNIKSRDVLIESLWKTEIFNKKRYEQELGTHWTSRPKMDNDDMLHVQFHLDRRDRSIKSFIGRKLGEYGLRL